MHVLLKFDPSPHLSIILAPFWAPVNLLIAFAPWKFNSLVESSGTTKKTYEKVKKRDLMNKELLWFACNLEMLCTNLIKYLKTVFKMVKCFAVLVSVFMCNTRVQLDPTTNHMVLAK